MGLTISKIKSYIPTKLRIVLNYFKNFNNNPYTLRSLVNPYESISDFFVFDKDCSKLVFVAENIRAILLGYEFFVTHK